MPSTSRQPTPPPLLKPAEDLYAMPSTSRQPTPPPLLKPAEDLYVDSPVDSGQSDGTADAETVKQSKLNGRQLETATLNIKNNSKEQLDLVEGMSITHGHHQLAFLDLCNVPRETHSIVPTEVVYQPSPPSPQNQTPDHSQSPVSSPPRQALPLSSQITPSSPQAGPSSSHIPLHQTLHLEMLNDRKDRQELRMMLEE
ncbi:unnamed protein product [Colias eurytheme]|nr:unnamed protein product [Colias eurytheme]